MDGDVVVVSNRGPYTFDCADDGEVVRRPAAGGLASALAPAVAEAGATWVAAAVTPGDRVAALRPGAGAPIRLELLALDEEDYRRFYGDVSNQTLWFLHHGIFDTSRRPTFNADWYRSWQVFRAVNEAFAQAVDRSAPEGAVVLVQDFHLASVGAALTRRRPDLRLVHFSHTPFASPSELRVLPEAVARELLAAMGAYRACGFHCDRWAQSFRACYEEVLGESPRTFVAPLGPHRQAIETIAGSDMCGGYQVALDEMLGSRRLIARVDRLDPSKNLLRGFLAFDELLAEHPGWRGNVTFLAVANPTREALPEYYGYRRQVEATVATVNQRWGRPGWRPIVLSIGDSIESSIAALARSDVLLVNSVRDGLNLVAKEGPLVNSRDGVLVLSRESGAWAEMHDVSLGVDPFDVSETRLALIRALEMTQSQRRALAVAAKQRAVTHDPSTWLEAQLQAASIPARV